MRRITIILILLVIILPVSGQGFGFGYLLDMGGSCYHQPGDGYSQCIYSITHNGFIRFHSRNGHNAFQLMVGLRRDTIPFRNHTEFLSPDGVTMMRYNTNAYLKRDALKLSAINQLQFGRPGRLVLSFNTGLHYEHTVHARRYGYNDSFSYNLNHEINFDDFGYLLGAEIRLAWFTVGYKFEQLFVDLLNHDYILSRELRLDNSSELRGLVLNPPMHFVYLGINIDFFKKH
jgi:hypothetical protein